METKLKRTPFRTVFWHISYNEDNIYNLHMEWNIHVH